MKRISVFVHTNAQCLVVFAMIALAIMMGAVPLWAKKRNKNLYTLPEQKSAKVKTVNKNAPANNNSNNSSENLPIYMREFLVGNAEGLFRVTPDNVATPLWTAGSVEQIVEVTLNTPIPTDLNNSTTATDITNNQNISGETNSQTTEITQNDPPNSSIINTTNTTDIKDATNNSTLQVTNNQNKKQIAWYFRTSCGVLYTSDLEHFELRNNGLPFLTIKKCKQPNNNTNDSQNGDETSDGDNPPATDDTVTFERVIHTLKDICVDPFNSDNIITATKDCVYLSRDAGLNWKSLGSMSNNTSGMKAVAITTIKGNPATETKKATDDELVAFMSHPIFGLSYMRLNARNPAWVDVSGGLDLMNTMTQTDEISDILPIKKVSDGGTITTEIYMAQTYIPRIYRFNWEARRAERIWCGATANGTVDGLTMVGNTLLYSTIEGLGSLDVTNLTSPGIPAKLTDWKGAFSSAGSYTLTSKVQNDLDKDEPHPIITNCAWVGSVRSGFSQSVCLNELWLLTPGTINTRYAARANGVKCVYASAYQCRLQSGIDKFRNILRENKLNGLVIDMKDDYGLLRYQTNDPFVASMAKVTQYKVDLDHFVSEFKKDGTYLVARIVVFKDRNLANFGGGKYSIWNYKTNAPWLGIKGYEDITDEEGNVVDKKAQYYDEKWVDPYCPIVWEYNTAIARELIARGFDEVQFDYIRFPTDGLNLGSCSYRWKSDGMDKEAALISFLRHARANINAPIGIDIYGANGWYRSGTRTGQDVEMLSEYVDVIGPMFYPSHFEQGFLDEAPWEDRTYRIYYYGTYRNTIMARNRVIVRPWVQAFYLNVRYDRQYYNKEYVIKQVYGVRDSVDRGYMYWNNGGNYDTISPDVSADDKYIGTTPESNIETRPSIGREKASITPVVEKNPLYSESEVLSALDSIYYNRRRDTVKNASLN